MTITKTIVNVGIADTKTVRHPNTIRTLGLGSCIGTVLYDEKRGIAGLSHILLPNSSQARAANSNPMKYADTAIPQLLKMLQEQGARNIKAKMAGGAQMFQAGKGTSFMRIGDKNIEAVQEALRKLNIRIVSSDVGGNLGRTIEFDPGSSKLSIRKRNHDIYTI
ncbi:chemotaxis protein CheD [Oceanobacillus neutriphilus]|uniref:Probable chemoreceptor glutamine deamidase CheD n=1 Tax=Oceanobacillus neutriphilus TaxID=531815 RepID=A0ABQ2NWR2_9BACI|nr:chemotaxis protein CheD [Oceanobacillus neutriphilus]GGP12413.1 chemoreceptor glutamine deamidase CheD [Oceanobacillus neutriphilus]